ncbi:MAG: GNAT family N-acetyltransferase [Bacteroidales bacterium]|nr:GNAT family N-acetyltransferase [Bacteroidales bacterium]
MKRYRYIKSNAFTAGVFAPKFGYLEDPATGSGNSAFANYLLSKKIWNGNLITIEQGGNDRIFNSVKLKHTNGQVLFGGKATVRIEGDYLLGPGLTWVHMEKRNNMTLRTFVASDAETILSWCKNKHDFRLWSADRFADYPAKPSELIAQLEKRDKIPMVAMVDNDVVGFLMLRYPTDAKTIIRFGFVIVDDAKRGLGYGKQMLKLAIDYARNKLGATTITLGVFCNNTSAINCYKSLGFETTGEDCYTIDNENGKD